MYAGGILYRLVSDSLISMVRESLNDLHWFDDGRGHLPVTLYPEPIEASESVQPNAISFSMEDITNQDIELGTNLAEHTLSYYIDIYGENKALALHLAGDIKDILEGRFPSIYRNEAHFEVLDLANDSATPTKLFLCEIEEVEIDRNRFGDRPFEKFWWTVAFDLVFSYHNELD